MFKLKKKIAAFICAIITISLVLAPASAASTTISQDMSVEIDNTQYNITYSPKEVIVETDDYITTIINTDNGLVHYFVKEKTTQTIIVENSMKLVDENETNTISPFALKEEYASTYWTGDKYRRYTEYYALYFQGDVLATNTNYTSAMEGQCKNFKNQLETADGFMNNIKDQLLGLAPGNIGKVINILQGVATLIDLHENDDSSVVVTLVVGFLTLANPAYAGVSILVSVPLIIAARHNCKSCFERLRTLIYG